MVLGDSGTVLEAVADRLDGLIVAGFGVGHVPSRVVATLTPLRTPRSDPMILEPLTSLRTVGWDVIEYVLRTIRRR